MKLVDTVLDLSVYEDELLSLVRDESCHIYLDTNVLLWLYRLSSSARNEIFKWFKDISTNGRLHIPAWVASEYNRLVLKNTNDEAFFPSKRIVGRIESDLEQISNLAQLIADDEFVNGTSFSTSDDYVSKMKDAVESLNKLIKPLKGLQKVNKELIHKTIRDELGCYVIETNLHDVLSHCAIIAEQRFSHEIPPGFDDSGKKNNRYGDLILWTEILRNAKSESHVKTIFVTNDGKFDWVYKPHNVKLRDGTVVGNNGKRTKEYSVPSPQLISEFVSATGSDCFKIVDISLVAEMLFRSSPQDYSALATAVQIDQSMHIIEQHDSSRNNIPENNDAENTVIADHSMATVGVVSGVININSESTMCLNASVVPNEDLPLLAGYEIESNAISDGNYVSSDAAVADIILDLKSHNWYTQNPAVSKVDEVIRRFNESAVTKEKVNDVFVLGRNIYQAACGGAFAAIDYLKQLQRKQYLQQYLEVFLAGCLFEIYFGADGSIRRYPNNDAAEYVVPLGASKHYSSAREFVNYFYDHSNGYSLFKITDSAVQWTLEFDSNKRLTNIVSLSGNKLLSSDNYESGWAWRIDDVGMGSISIERLRVKLSQITFAPSFTIQGNYKLDDNVVLNDHLRIRSLMGD